MSLFRDVLIIQLSAATELVNTELKNQIEQLAITSSASETISRLEAISTARIRIGANVRDLMVLESVAVALKNTK
jgi:DNA polymerase-3 subunit delta'